MNIEKPLRIGFLGQGNVGSEVINQLHTQGAMLARRAGRPIIVEAIHRRHPEHAGDFFTRNRDLYRPIKDILSDPIIDVICELIGDVELTRQAILQALRNGKHVVTANKAFLADELPLLRQEAKLNNVQLRFEAAVAGGIPIIECLQTNGANDNIDTIRGIINGTTNFVLWKMATQGTSLANALRNAQELGYAEADPRADIFGHDAAQKLSVLIECAFGEHIKPPSISTCGIDKITSDDIKRASEQHRVVKLIAHAERTQKGIHARVGPENVPEESLFGQVPSNGNVIEMSNAHGVVYTLCGEGAGGKPTAASVLADILALAQSSERTLRNR